MPSRAPLCWSWIRRRLTVMLVSKLAPQLARQMGLQPAPTIDDAVAHAARLLPEGADALYLERAGALLPPLRRRRSR